MVGMSLHGIACMTAASGKRAKEDVKPLIPETVKDLIAADKVCMCVTVYMCVTLCVFCMCVLSTGCVCTICVSCEQVYTCVEIETPTKDSGVVIAC